LQNDEGKMSSNAARSTGDVRVARTTGDVRVARTTGDVRVADDGRLYPIMQRIMRELTSGDGPFGKLLRYKLHEWSTRLTVTGADAFEQALLPPFRMEFMEAPELRPRGFCVEVNWSKAVDTLTAALNNVLLERWGREPQVLVPARLQDDAKYPTASSLLYMLEHVVSNYYVPTAGGGTSASGSPCQGCAQDLRPDTRYSVLGRAGGCSTATTRRSGWTRGAGPCTTCASTSPRCWPGTGPCRPVAPRRSWWGA
jgi:hypothetical protein